MTDISNAEDDLAERLNRSIGRLQALNECVEVVNRALEADDDLEVVRDWLGQQLDEIKVERDMLISEWAEIKAAKEAG